MNLLRQCLLCLICAFPQRGPGWLLTQGWKQASKQSFWIIYPTYSNSPCNSIEPFPSAPPSLGMLSLSDFSSSQSTTVREIPENIQFRSSKEPSVLNRVMQTSHLCALSDLECELSLWPVQKCCVPYLSIHLAISLIRLTVTVSQCLCSSNIYFV